MPDPCLSPHPADLPPIQCRCQRDPDHDGPHRDRGDKALHREQVDEWEGEL